MAWPIIGRAFTPAQFADYVRDLKWGSGFRPTFVCLHNTAAPSLAQRPAGLTRQHILNLQNYYKNEKKWGGGPHLFIDDKQIWVFNDLTKRGVHSPSWNATALGIEMLGDYECESFNSGRGAKVRANTVAAMAALNNRLGFAADAFRFHIEDKKSDHACPGKLARAERAELVVEIESAMAGTRAPVAVAKAAERLVIPAADPPQDAPKPGLLNTTSFAKVNELAEQGSRLAQHIKSFKAGFWKLTGLATTGGTIAASTVDTSKGTGHALSGLASEHPFILAALVGAVVGGLAYAYVKLRIEPGLVSAAKDDRYRPRGA